MMSKGTPRFIGRSLPRREDRRLLTGSGQFIADLTLPGQLHAIFVRSQVAHGHIRSVDTAAAAAMPGVRRVLTGADLLQLAPTVGAGPWSMPSKWRAKVRHKIQLPQQTLLAVQLVNPVHAATACGTTLAAMRLACCSLSISLASGGMWLSRSIIVGIVPSCCSV